MLGINVIILHKDDPGPALPDAQDEETEELYIKDFVIVEEGTMKRGISVAFHLIDGDGKHYLAQTSAALFNSLAESLRGAMYAFNDKNDQHGQEKE